MSSIKKTSSIIIIAILVAGVALGVIDQLNTKESYVLDEIDFDAIYLENKQTVQISFCLLYTSPSPRDATLSRMPSSA